jgi:hypothetical protein
MDKIILVAGLTVLENTKIISKNQAQIPLSKNFGWAWLQTTSSRSAALRGHGLVKLY